MRKKILCAIMSSIMVVGALAGCGSSSEDTSKKVEESIMTQIIPGESTADELEKYLQDKSVTWESDKNGEPRDCTNTDYFLGHEAQFSEFDYKNGIVYSYRVEVAFKNVDDYKTGLNEIKEYFEKMGTGITGYNDDEGADKEPINCYLLKDETDYYTVVMPWVSTYDEVEGDYYNSILKFVYYRVDKNNEAGETFLWKDKDGNSYTTKFDKASDKSVNFRDSTESIKREDSTEVSKETNNNIYAWKQTYIDYFNNSNLKVLDSEFIDTDNKDIHLLACSIDNGAVEGKLFYINKKNEVTEIAKYNLNREDVRYNKYGCISILRTPTLYDSSFGVYEYDANLGSYSKTYEGFAALDQDRFLKDGAMKYNCKINGNECDYESYQIERNTYENGTGFFPIRLSEVSIGVSVIDTIKNY